MTRSGARAAISRKLLQSVRWTATPLPLRDEAADRIRRRRPAAARQAGQQRIDADDEHAAARALAGRERFAARSARRRGGGSRRAQQRLDVAQREFVLADDLEQRLGVLEAELRRQVVELERGPALALQQLLDRLAAARDRLRSAPAR